MPDSPFYFGTVGSPNSTPKKPGGSVGAVLRIRELGLGALELGWVNAVRVSEQSCQAIRDTAHEQEVRISVHAPYFINMNADDEEWPKSRKRLMDAAYYGNLAGATDIVFHPGSYFGLPAEMVLPNISLGEWRLSRAAGNPVILRPGDDGKIRHAWLSEDTLQMAQEILVEPCLILPISTPAPGMVLGIFT
jgi:deoxyribonuclease-4